MRGPAICSYNPDIMTTKIRLTREQSREQTRQRLLHATRVLFAAQGFAATSVAASTWRACVEGSSSYQRRAAASPVSVSFA